MVTGLIDGNRMIVFLTDMVGMLSLHQLPDFTKPISFTSKTVVLERVRFYDTLRVDKDGLHELVYEIWVPPAGDYTDKEIQRMRSHCDYAGVRFQLHDPRGYQR